jgi:hypothetical protein
MMNHRRAMAAAPAANSECQTALWVIAVLLAIIATVLVLQATGGRGASPVYADSPMMGGRGVFAFTGQIDRDRYGLFMMDVDNSTVWAYEYLPSTRKLRLAFARSYTFDRYLEDFGLDEQTAPRRIGELLNAQRERKARDTRGAADAGLDNDGTLSTSLPGMPATTGEGAAAPPARR